MDEKLGGKIRSPDFNDRKSGVREPASLRTKEAVRPLIHVMRGKRQRLFRPYTPDDQLAAIECLGDAASKATYVFPVKTYRLVILEYDVVEQAFSSPSDVMHEQYRAYATGYRTVSGDLHFALGDGDPGHRHEPDPTAHHVIMDAIHCLARH